MSFAGHAASSNGCVARPKGRETGLTGYAGPIQRSLPIGSSVMEAAEHREPCESRGSRTVLGARGGEIPPRDSTKPEVHDVLLNVRSWRYSRHRFRAAGCLLVAISSSAVANCRKLRHLVAIRPLRPTRAHGVRELGGYWCRSFGWKATASCYPGVRCRRSSGRNPDRLAHPLSADSKAAPRLSAPLAVRIERHVPLPMPRSFCELTSRLTETSEFIKSIRVLWISCDSPLEAFHRFLTPPSRVYDIRQIVPGLGKTRVYAHGFA